MVASAGTCPSCGFENPKTWRTCARCGHVLLKKTRGGLTQAGDSPPSGENTAVDPTPVGPPPVAITTTPEAEPDTAAIDIGLPEGERDDAHAAQEGREPDEPLIGQQEAAEAIRTGVERAFTVGMPTLVALEGPRGSGKTRLLAYASEIAARASSDVRVLYAATREGGGDGIYAPFSRLLLDRFGVTPSSAPSTVRGQMATAVSQTLRVADAITVAETTHLLGHVAGIPFPDSPFLGPLESKPDELRKRANAAVRRFIESEGQVRPVVLLFDNMHHADGEGWDMLAEILRAEGHLAVVITGDAPLAERAQKLQPPGGIAVGPIEPLREEDVSAMLYVLLPTLTHAPEPLVSALAHRSGGNPSLLRELVFGLLESGLFVDGEQGLSVDIGVMEGGGLPVTMEDAIRMRLKRLDPLERATLDRAAIVGEVFWDGALLAQMRSERAQPADADDPGAVWPDDEDEAALHAALDRLADKGFVERNESTDLSGNREYSFTLAGTRQLMYADQPEDQRVRRHTSVARWLAVIAELRREGVAAMIAPHLERAGLTARAGRAYLEAAEYERSKMRTTTALRYVERALPLIDRDDVARKIEALHEHGSLLSLIGRYDEAMQSFLQMHRLAWSVGARGKGGAALNRIGRVHRQRGEDEIAQKLLARALELFRSAGDLRGVASTLDDLAQVLRLRGEPDRALEAATEALEIRRAHADERGEAVSLSTIGMVQLGKGSLDVAENCFRDALAIRVRIGDHEGMLQSHNALGILAYERGDMAGATASWRNALEQAREVADRRSQTFLLNNLGEAQLSMGQTDEALRDLTQARELAEALGDRRAQAEVERNLGLCALKRGDDDAVEKLVRALRLAEEYGGKEAIALAQRAIGTFRAQTLFDQSGELDRRAEECFLISIDLFREIGNEKEAARSLAELAYHLIERGETDTARERLREARSIMRKIGLADVARVERTLSELG